MQYNKAGWTRGGLCDVGRLCKSMLRADTVANIHNICYSLQKLMHKSKLDSAIHYGASVVTFHTVLGICLDLLLRTHLPTQETWDKGFNPWVGKIPWRRAWQPTLQYPCLGNPMERNLMGYSPWGRRLDQLRRLSIQAQSDSFPSDYSIGYRNLFSAPNTAPAKVTNDLSAPSATDARHPPGLQHRWSVLLSPGSPLTLALQFWPLLSLSLFFSTWHIPVPGPLLFFSPICSMFTCFSGFQTICLRLPIPSPELPSACWKVQCHLKLDVTRVKMIFILPFPCSQLAMPSFTQLSTGKVPVSHPIRPFLLLILPPNLLWNHPLLSFSTGTTFLQVT